MPVARRGEIWQVDLGMTAKVRPALVLSVPFTDIERAVFEIIPHTTAIRATRFEVALPIPGLEAGAFDAQGLRSVPASVFLRRLGNVTPAQMSQVEAAVKRWLGLI